MDSTTETSPASSISDEDKGIHRGEGSGIRFCPICGEEAPLNESHYVHYGGVSCYSCRAFFRRAHQMTKEPTFHCRAEGKRVSWGTCEVSVANRRKCQKCRYRRCLDCGMDPKLVLTNSQIRERFKNSIRRRKVSDGEPDMSLTALTGQRSKPLPVPSNDYHYSQDAGSLARPAFPTKRINFSEQETDALSCSPVGSTLDRPCRKRELEEEEMEERKRRKREKKLCLYDINRINDISQCFATASTQENLKISNELVAKFVNLHRARGKIEEADLVTYITYLVSTFTTFAKCQSLFKSLSTNDQLALLVRNASHYIQYVLARYFTAKTGLEQLQWLLGLQLPVELISENSGLVKVHASDWVGVLSFAQSPMVMSSYLESARKASALQGCSPVYNAIVVNMILYHQQPDMELEESRRIGYIFQEACWFLAKATSTDVSKSNNRQFFVCLGQMNDIFSNASFSLNLGLEETADKARRSFMPIPGADYPSCIAHVALGFTSEDKMFLHQQYALFQRCYSSLPMSNLILKMYYESTLYDKKVPFNILPHAIEIFMERFRKVFFNVTENFGFHPEDQRRLWSRNCAIAVIFNILKMETAESGNHQFSIAMGQLENPEAVKSSYNMDFNFLDMEAVSAGRLGKDLLKLYFALVSKVDHLVKDGKSFMLISLITMLETPHDYNLVSGYQLKKQLQRKLIRLLNCHQQSLGQGMIFQEAKFNQILEYLLGLSQFLPKLCTGI